MYIGLHANHPLFLSDFDDIQSFSTNFRKLLKCQISRKSVKWEPSCSMRTTGRTDRHDKAHGSFSNFLNAP
jgi:hypothetical protein